MRPFIILYILLLTSFLLPQETLRTIPACMLNYKFGPERNLLIVDKQSHTLFVFSNYQDTPLAQFKVTTGKAIGQKVYEGDNRTPEGIYFFKQIISGLNLPKIEDYGEKAFITDYPNPMDLHERRNGSGIWLHGANNPVKIDSPTNSRGCVVMSNDDLTQVSKYIFLNQTPLCIYETIPYVSVEEITRRREAILGRLSGWKQAWESKDTDSYIEHYAQEFSIEGMNRRSFHQYKDNLNRRYRYIRVLINNLTLYGYTTYTIMSFNQMYISDINQVNTHKIQYWHGDNQDPYVIIAEESRRLPQPEKIELAQGNFVTIEQFRLITDKKLTNQAETVLPEQPTATTTEITFPALSGLQYTRQQDQIEIQLSLTNEPSSWRYIPVLSVVSAGSTEHLSLPGITLKGGVPQDTVKALNFNSTSEKISFPLPNNSQPRSLTLFLVDSQNQIKLIITSFFSP